MSYDDDLSFGSAVSTITLEEYRRTRDESDLVHVVQHEPRQQQAAP